MKSFPAKWKTTETSLIARLSASASVISPDTNSAPLSTSGLPDWGDRASTRTCASADSNCRTKLVPRKPVAPVTKVSIPASYSWKVGQYMNISKAAGIHYPESKRVSE
jgi:hypothetical protein